MRRCWTAAIVLAVIVSVATPCLAMPPVPEGADDRPPFASIEIVHQHESANVGAAKFRNNGVATSLGPEVQVLLARGGGTGFGLFFATDVGASTGSTFLLGVKVPLATLSFF